MTESAQAEYDRLRNAAEAAAVSRKKSKAKSTSSNQEKLFRALLKTLLLMEADLKHPSFNTHKFDGIANPIDPSKSVFEAYVQNHTPGAYRVFWVYGPREREMTIVAITPHP